MARKNPTNWPRVVLMLVLWVIAANACLLVGLTRGCEAWRNWNASKPLPEGCSPMVRRLEEYKAQHGRYPTALSDAGPLDERVEERRVLYRLVEDSDAQEFELSIGVYPHSEYVFDDCWRYESRKGRWIYFSLSQGGG